MAPINVASPDPSLPNHELSAHSRLSLDDQVDFIYSDLTWGFRELLASRHTIQATYARPDFLEQYIDIVDTLLDQLEALGPLQVVVFQQSTNTDSRSGSLPVLLASYIAALLPIVETFGSGLLFATNYIERLIAIYTRAALRCGVLYLAQADYLRLKKIDDPEREVWIGKAIEEARKHHDNEKLIEALLARCRLYNDTSRYFQAIEICRTCEMLINENPTNLRKFLPEVRTQYGVNYYTLLKYRQARRYFEEVNTALKLPVEHALLSFRTQHVSPEPELILAARTLNTAVHYLGRVEEVNGNMLTALTCYIRANDYLELCLEGIAPVAFYHLRVADVLLGSSKISITSLEARLLTQAEEHLSQAEEMFGRIRYKSSGIVQSQLAFARLYERRGELGIAKDAYTKALQIAQDQFPRGELLCRKEQFWFELRQRRLVHAVSIFFRVFLVNRRGELERQGYARLYGIYLWRMFTTPVRVLARTRAGKNGTSTHSLITCTCPLHSDVMREVSKVS